MQQRDAYIQKRLKEKDSKYSIKTFKRSDYTYNLVMYDDGSNDRIALPKALGKAVATWYHDILCHPGEVRTELSISQHFYWKGMRNTITSVCKKCATCLHNKPTSETDEMRFRQARVLACAFSVGYVTFKSLKLQLRASNQRSMHSSDGS
jgi:hypothetical protein